MDQNSLEPVFFDCHLSRVGRQLTIENFISKDFWSTFVESINVFDCRLPGVLKEFKTISAVCIIKSMPHYVGKTSLHGMVLQNIYSSSIIQIVYRIMHFRAFVCFYVSVIMEAGAENCWVDHINIVWHQEQVTEFSFCSSNVWIIIFVAYIRFLKPFESKHPVVQD